MKEAPPEVVAQPHQASAQTPEVPAYTELAVDLPQGQRLTIKGIEPGTIVEVASWSGKGGPDEGAVRMLFGASGDDKDVDATGPSKTVASDSAAVTGRMDVVAAEDLRHDSGIDDILGEATSIDQQVPAIKHHTAPELEEQPRGRRMLKRAIVLVSIVLGVVAVVVTLRLTNTVYFEHPTGGLSTSLGGAGSSIVAVNPGSDVEPNSTVIATIDGQRTLVAVAQVGGDQYLVYNGSSQTVVNKSDVVGRVLFVVPFLGYLAGGG